LGSCIDACWQIIALFSRPWFILLGGAFAALGVLGMHYLGMMAQRMNADMSFDMSIVAASVAIAYIACNAACWILFRVVRTRLKVRRPMITL
jgi:NO-binding membrane sensor protein with MHYT domain